MTVWQTLSPSFIMQSYSLLILCFHPQATGIQLGTLVEIFSGILIGLFVALYFSLLTTLLFMWVLLILVFARILQLKVFTRYTTKHVASRKKKKRLENAGKVSHLDSCLKISVDIVFGLWISPDYHKPTVDWESNKGNKLVSSIEISITCA